MQPDYGKMNEAIEEEILGVARPRVYTPKPYPAPTDHMCIVCGKGMAMHYHAHVWSIPTGGEFDHMLCDYPEADLDSSSLKPESNLSDTTFYVGTLIWCCFLWLVIFIGVMAVAMNDEWIFLTAVLWGAGCVATGIVKDVYARMTEETKEE